MILLQKYLTFSCFRLGYSSLYVGINRFQQQKRGYTLMSATTSLNTAPISSQLPVASITTESKKEKAERKQRIQPIPGYGDYTEAQHVALSKMKSILSRVYEEHGFTGFISRPVEFWDNLRKDGTDQQVFRICRDNGELTDIALPFDRTVSLALYVARYGDQIAFPFKRQDINISHRGEHPQPGRFRGFYQCDVDIVSDQLTPVDDVECLVTLMEGLNQLGVTNTVMYLNEIKLPQAMIASLGIAEGDIPAVLRCVDKLDKKTQSEVVSDIMLICPNLDREKVAGLIAQFDYKGSITEFKLDSAWGEKAQKAVDDLKLVFNLLPAYGIDMESVSFCPGMVRGLAYYTGLVFETFIKDQYRLGSIASGGRYVDLVGKFNPKFKHIGGVGGAIGLTRLFDILTRENMIQPVQRSAAAVTVACRSEAQLSKAVELATLLRKQGVNVDLFSDYRAKKFFSYADKKKIPYAVLVSEEAFAVKDILSDTHDKQRDFTTSKDALEYLIALVKK